MEKITSGILFAAIVVVVLWLVYAYVSWRWYECRHVGHGVVYCFLDLV